MAFGQTAPVTMSMIPNGTPGQKISIMIADRFTKIIGSGGGVRPTEGSFDLGGQTEIPQCFGTAIHTFEYNNAGLVLANQWKLINSKYHQFPGRVDRSGEWRPGGWDFTRNSAAPLVYPGANLSNLTATGLTTTASASPVPSP